MKEGAIMGHPGGKDKRQRIIEAAVKVFSQKGFHEAKVDEIAQLADVGKGTVYEYFVSKAELFREMFKDGMQFYLYNLNSELKAGLSCRAKLLRIAGLHLEFVTRYKDIAKITMTEQIYFDEDFHEWIRDSKAKKIELLTQIINEGITGGEFRQVDAYAAALALTGALGALCAPVIFTRNEINSQELIEPVMDIIFNGLLLG